MHDPRSHHWMAVKRILHFLKGTITHGLHFRQGTFVVTTYLDADWAEDPDDRHSTSGYAIFVGPNLVSWNSKKQPTVSKSSNESEYKSLALIAAELFWVCMLMRDLGIYIKFPPTIYCYNISAIALASNPIVHALTKNIEVDYHLIREKVLQGDIQVRFVNSIDQLADVFTMG